MAAFDFPNSPSNGDTYSANGIDWIYNGSVWKKDATAGVKGQKGELGVGDKGQKGQKGEKGEVGDKGQKGEIGPQGGSGGQGDKGDKGDKGQDGTDASGAKGQKGEASTVKGEKGQKGEVGSGGSDGSDGSDGSKGQKGEAGAAASKGQKGDAGTKGQKGDKGQTGATGSQTFTVTNSGASAYQIDGSNNPTLTLVRGFTYTFNVNASGHPFYIKTSATTGTGNQYTTGVTNNGVQVGTLTFVVPSNAPATLYYICQYHGSMVGTINTVENGQKGDKGDKGEVGSGGSDGDKGEKGVQGSSGSTGIPSGFIGLWSGAANAIPSGWYLCDGNNGTPNLKGKFIVGYDNNDSDFDVNDQGGSKNATLVSHSHSVSGTTGNDTHNHTIQSATSIGGGSRVASQNDTGNTASTQNDTHSHSFSANTNTQGSSATNANLPPYYALCYIMKS